MAVITPVKDSAPKPLGGMVLRYSGTSASNTDGTLTSVACPKTCYQRLVYVSVHYSGASTQAGVTVTLDSGLGSSFDLILKTFSANEEENVYSPDEEIYLLNGDAILVTAPAGGSGVTASCQIVLEQT